MLEVLQSSWLLLVHCAAARANYMMWVVETGSGSGVLSETRCLFVEVFLHLHTSRGVTPTQCQRHCVNVSRVGRPWVEECGSHKEGSLLGQLGRLSFDGSATSSTGGCSVGHRARRKSCVPILASSQCRELTGKMEFALPSSAALALGERPPMREPEDREPGMFHRGWQHEACTHVEGAFRAELFTFLLDQTRALVRSQAGLGAALKVTPTNRETTIPSHLFRVVLLRRLRLALPLSVRS